MADMGSIDSVLANLPADASEDGWDTNRIGLLLDTGLSVAKVTLSFWAGRVAKLSTVVDVSESGSSRQLSNLFNQAKTAYDLWLEKSKLEDNPVIPNRYRAAFHKLNRV
jgi:hypothetical protein